MRCCVLKCHENEDGYCMCSSYVEINENGQCKSMRVRHEENEEDESV